MMKLSFLSVLRKMQNQTLMSPLLLRTGLYMSEQTKFTLFKGIN